MMKTTVVNVTPAIARKYLEGNTQNRRLRHSHVETLRASFERGEYVMTHQGIAISDTGVLIDGQHRLTAISLLPGSPEFPMLVSTGCDRDSVYCAVDGVQAKRTTSDVLGVPTEIGQCASFFAKMYVGRTDRVTPQFAKPFGEWCEKEVVSLTSFCNTASRTWSSTPVRAAFVIAMKTGIDPDYVKTLYRAMVLAEFDGMSLAAQSLFRAHLSGRVRAAVAYDIFVRVIKIADPKNQQLTKIQIKDQSRVIASVRELMENQIGLGQKKAPVIAGARKSVSSTNYRLAGL